MYDKIYSVESVGRLQGLVVAKGESQLVLAPGNNEAHLVLMYNVQNSKAPVRLRNLFKEKENSVYNLRSNNNSRLAVGKPQTEYLKRTFVYSGAKIWNNLPCEVKQYKSRGTLKRELSSVRP